MKKRSAVLLLAAALATSACYHATIETGMAASGQSFKQPWAMSFVAGLIPPPIVETAQRCPDGVAKVETQHSFMNALVAAVTGSIVTPMTIEVQCAAPRRAELEQSSVIRVGGMGTIRAVEVATQRAIATGEPVYLKF